MPGVRIPPEDDLDRDLPRVDKTAQTYQIVRSATPSL
jgi:hypothetical protein